MELQILELMDLVGDKEYAKNFENFQLSESAMEDIECNWEKYQNLISNRIIELIYGTVTDELMIKTLIDLDTSRQNAIMIDEYD